MVTRSNHKTWVHPYVAINIAQWASPDFAAQVCIWVFEIIVTGKVDSSNLTDYNILKEKFQQSLEELEVIKSDNNQLLINNQEIQANNNELEEEIEYLRKRLKELESKLLKKQKRLKFSKGYYIYIVQAKPYKDYNLPIYKIGKTSDMTARFSSYQTSVPHELIFHIDCHTEDFMDTIEQSLFVMLDRYRIEPNHENFKLPENKDITFFENTIKKLVDTITMEL